METGVAESPAHKTFYKNFSETTQEPAMLLNLLLLEREGGTFRYFESL
jgi:hypothetical protein